MDQGRSSFCLNYLVGLILALFGAPFPLCSQISNGAFPDSLDPNPSSPILAVAIQTDRKILIGGAFTNICGETRNCIGRLNQDGTLDSFNPGANSEVACITVQEDGKILAGGGFSQLAGQPCNRIGRLNPTGTLDSSFDPGPGASDGILPSVNCLAVLPDGKILVAGSFQKLCGQPRIHIGRLNPDGSLDISFDAKVSVGFYGYTGINTMAVQPDGKILIGGRFSAIAGQLRAFIARLNPDGSLDAFNPGADQEVTCVALQSDGKILVGGAFGQLAGNTQHSIGRLYPDGIFDTSFRFTAPHSAYSFGPQADGKSIIGGYIFFARVNLDGTGEAAFLPSVDDEVNSLALQPDGNVLVSGKFTTLAGQSRSNCGRIIATDAATENLTYDGSSVTWLRGGSAPGAWRTSFAACTNGTDWIELGAGKQIPGGWELTDVHYPPGTVIRGRAFISSGYRNGSGWVLQTFFPQGTPRIFAHDGHLRASPDGFGFNVTCEPDSQVVVECSSDLLNWNPLTNSFGALHFNDHDFTNSPQRFYRARPNN